MGHPLNEQPNMAGMSINNSNSNQNINVNNSTPNVNNTSVNNGIPAEPSNTTNNEIPNQIVNTSNNIPSSSTDLEKPKKKVSPVVIIAAVLLLVVGVGSLYYFVLDKPNKAFSTAFNKFLSSVPVYNLKNKYINYDLNINISTENEQYKYYADVINKLNINATIGLDNDNNVISNGLITYNDSELLNYSALYNNNIAYLKANNILDKVIKVDLNKENDSPSNSSSIDETDLNNIRNSIINAINKAMDSADYKKELVELNGSRVKKYTLVIDKEFVNNTMITLSNDTTFLNSVAKLSGKSIDEIQKSLDTSNEDIATSELHIYTSLIKSEFLRLELISPNALLNVTKDNDNYNYEYSEDDTLLYSGYITYKKMGNETTFNLNIDVLEEATLINISSISTIFDDITKLETTAAVTIDELTEDEMTNAMDKIEKNQAFQALINDLDLNETGLEP